MITVRTLIAHTAQALRPVCIDEAHMQSTARHVVAHALGCSLTTLLLRQQDPVSAELEERVSDLVTRLVDNHEPLAYVLGHTSFCGLDIIVRPPLLIPRPETEWWCAELITTLKAVPSFPQTFLDLCTGTGCIALACADAFPGAHVYAVDKEPLACACTRENATHLQLTNVTVLEGDLWEPVDASDSLHSFDVITANPPYIPYAAWKTLEPSVKQWEDPHALHDDKHSETGTSLLARIIEHAPAHLKPDGWLWIECDSSQKEWCLTAARNAGFSFYEVRDDQYGRPRVLTARR